MDWERVSVHTMALWRGSPVSWSQTTVVSRWLVIPTQAMLVRAWPWLSKDWTAPAMQVSTDETSSRGSCSCQLGLRKQVSLSGFVNVFYFSSLFLFFFFFLVFVDFLGFRRGFIPLTPDVGISGQTPPDEKRRVPHHD